jgi:signal transduction histidine kinase
MLRVDAGQFVLHPERLSVADLVSSALARFEGHLDGHDVVTDVPASLTVDGDRELLGLALRQLIDNSLKYSPSSSKIEIRADVDDIVRLAVRNSGSVIAQADRARIFERFYRSGAARQIPGTGMGLAIVRQIAEAHRGTVTMSSTPEAGTAFTLSLPKEGVAA